MLNCSKCGKESIDSIAACELRSNELCQFDCRIESYSGSRRQGWTIIFLALLFLFLITIFPILPDSLSHGSALFGLIYSIILGLFVFLGIVGIVIGILLLFAKQITAVSLTDGQSYQESRIWGRSYKTTEVELIGPIEFETAANLPMPASLAVVGSNTSIDNLTTDERMTLAETALIAALFDLLNRRLISVQKAQIYQTEGQQIEYTRDIVEYLFLPAEINAAEFLSLGNLEQILLEKIGRWKLTDNWHDCPLAPRVRELVISLANLNKSSGVDGIIEQAISKSKALHFDSDPEARKISLELFKDLSSNNLRLFNDLEKTIRTALETLTPGTSLKKSVNLKNPLFARYVRNSLIVGIILIFTAGRSLLGVDIISDAGKNFFREHGIRERSEQIVEHSTTQAGNSFWQSIRWMDQQLAKLESFIQSFRNVPQQSQQTALEIKRLMARGDQASQQQAAKILATAEFKTDEMISMFKSLINDADAKTRAAALEALKEHEDVAAELIPDMVDLLGSDSVTAELSSENLMQLSEAKGLELEKSLHQALKSQDLDIQNGAKQLLKDLGLN